MNTEKEYNVSFHFKIPIDLREWLEKRSEKENKPSSEIVRESIREKKQRVESK